VQAMEPIFHYKQSAPPRYILALDKSPPMDERVSFLDGSNLCLYQIPFTSCP